MKRLALVAATLLLTACAATGSSTSISGPAQQAQQVPQPTLSQTTDFQTFSSWMIGWNTDMQSILTDAGTAASGYDMAAVFSALDDLEAKSDEGLRWLNSHEPEPCYAMTHAQQIRVASAYKLAAQISQSDLSAGAAAINDATAEIETATELLSTVTCKLP